MRCSRRWRESQAQGSCLHAALRMEGAYTTSVGVPKTPSPMSRTFETRGGIGPDIGRGSSGERFEGNPFHDLLNGPLTTVDELCDGTLARVKVCWRLRST